METIPRLWELASERRARSLEERLERLVIVRQVHRIEEARELMKRVEIGADGATDPKGFLSRVHIPQNSLRLSSRMVTGPAPTLWTLISARKRPVSTLKPWLRRLATTSS